MSFNANLAFRIKIISPMHFVTLLCGLCFCFNFLYKYFTFCVGCSCQHNWAIKWRESLAKSSHDLSGRRDYSSHKKKRRNYEKKKRNTKRCAICELPLPSNFHFNFCARATFQPPQAHVPPLVFFTRFFVVVVLQFLPPLESISCTIYLWFHVIPSWAWAIFPVMSYSLECFRVVIVSPYLWLLLLLFHLLVLYLPPLFCFHPSSWALNLPAN